MGKYKIWKEYFKEKTNNIQEDPHCFYDLEGNYLPKDKKAVIIDVGCGKTCLFENYHNLWKEYKNLILLEINVDTIVKIIAEHKDCNIIQYEAPNTIPLENESVDFIYCSHMIEHLPFMDVYKLLKEFDKILKPNGILVIRSPMAWFGFYDTFDHIKPYPPSTFIQYLCGLETGSFSYKPISIYYKIKEITYRYSSFSSFQDKLGSSIKIIDFLIQGTYSFMRKLGFKRYKQTGYTVILKKIK